jgi:hypothetical protein
MSSEARDSAPAREGTDVARRLLVAVSALAIIGTVLGLLLVQRIGTTYRDGLEVARDSALVASTSTASVERLAADVSKLAASAATSLEQATTVVDSAAESAADIGTAFGTNVADALDGTASDPWAAAPAAAAVDCAAVTRRKLSKTTAEAATAAA